MSEMHVLNEMTAKSNRLNHAAGDTNPAWEVEKAMTAIEGLSLETLRHQLETLDKQRGIIMQLIKMAKARDKVNAPVHRRRRRKKEAEPDTTAE